MTDRVVVITGASNGMGYEAAIYFAEHGWQVYAGARRVEKIPAMRGITPLKLDVTDSASNHAFTEEILDKAGRIDVLINNAGYGEFGPAEEIPMEAVRKQFETNFFGAVELTQLVLPTMRRQASGRIINISSIGGDVYMPLGSYYHATKGALQQWSDVLDLELSGFGVRSVVVQPGGTQSSWGEIAMENAQANLSENSPYGPLVQTVQRAMSGITGGATSADLAKVFYRAATKEKAKLRYFNSPVDIAAVKIARVTPSLWRAGVKFALKRLGR